ncbi:Mu transposase C-terminal domain-containing protein [Zavarzinia compransoris]|uniref:Transposase n=1 Tax=Zavarzinia compransoris TaxID=1264899 RepID=A0A317EDU5_9PROT|nr:Mu transposase C-terminal domain-containing protein [Zavarzinia compransoris]PWR23385.1 hypothetical protein DKG75_02105 [Zavarzinia compransoris]TDP46042.1 putative transposase [Zavarzinia compransoris]
MKEWLSVTEIAALALPGLPSTDRGIRKYAKQNQWAAKERSDLGGGREYHVSALPAAAREELRRRALASERRAEVIATPAPAAPAKRDADLKSWQRDAMLARVRLVHEVEALARIGGLMAAYKSLAEAAADGALSPALMQAVTAANARKGLARALSAGTLRRWRDAYEAAGRNPLVLAPKPAANEQVMPPEWLSRFLDFYAIPSKPSVAESYETMQRLEPGVTLPALRTVHAAIAALPAVERARRRMGPRALRQMKAFVRRTTDELWPTAVYVTDGHTFDAQVAHPLTGKQFRPEITGTIDVVTRRLTGWSVALAEATWGTIGALRHAFTTSGVPDIWYVDNGKGFNNAILDGLLARFDVTQTNRLPYRAQAGGVIERAHQSIWIRAARRLATYVGVDMDTEARQRNDRAIEADIKETGGSPRLMPWPDFVAWCAATADAYNDRPHSSLPKIIDPATGKRRHESPNEAWSRWLAAGWIPDTLEGEDVDQMFRPQIQRNVRRCEIDLFTNKYFSFDLEPWHGEDVLVGYDIHDASKVWVYTLEGRLICEAAWGGNEVSFKPRSVVDRAHDQRHKNQVGRKQRALDEAEGANRPALEIVAETAMPMAPIEPREVAPLVLVEAVPEAAPVRAAAPVRPAFGTDFEMAAWLLAHPEQITGTDADYLLEQVRRRTVQQRLEAGGIDPAHLKSVLLGAATSHQGQVG